jgi:Cu+-exporting ATPase
MAVDEKTAAATVSYEGRTYHFCSAGCLSKFEKEPGKFAGRAGKP